MDRIKQYLDYKGISVSSFEKSLGMANASFGKTLKNNGSIGIDKLEKILKVYPDINPLWLVVGDGQMLATATHIGDNSISTHGSSRAEVNYYSGGDIEALKKENDALRAENDYLKNLNAKYLSIIENLTTPKL